MACEESGMWPSQEQDLHTRLLAKPQGGYRPIMLFRSLFRVYSRIRSKVVKQWAQGIGMHEINMQPRRWVSDPIWRSLVRREINEDKHGECSVMGEIQWDLKESV